MPKTIALVCPDGLSILLFCKGIIRALQRMDGARVVVVSDDGEYQREIEALGVTRISLPISRYATPVADLQYCYQLSRIFRRERCDLVLNFSTKPNIYGTIAARLARVPRVVSHVVGLGAAFLPSVSIKARVIRIVFETLYRVSAGLADRVWFTNKNDLAYFVDHRLLRPEKAVLTRNYLDTDEYAPGVASPAEIDALRSELGYDASHDIVIMVARLIWSKGVREFIDAAALLRDRVPRLRFVLVAPHEAGNADAIPESFVRDASARDSTFRWLGFRRDVKQLYALATLAVLPSYYKEGGYPRALLEPMAIGKPVITTTSEDCRGVVDEGQNGYLVPVRDAGALADAIERIVLDSAKLATFGRHSREKAIREFDERPIIDEAFSKLGIAALASRTS